MRSPEETGTVHQADAWVGGRSSGGFSRRASCVSLCGSSSPDAEVAFSVQSGELSYKIGPLEFCRWSAIQHYFTARTRRGTGLLLLTRKVMPGRQLFDLEVTFVSVMLPAGKVVESCRSPPSGTGAAQRTERRDAQVDRAEDAQFMSHSVWFWAPGCSYCPA